MRAFVYIILFVIGYHNSVICQGTDKSIVADYLFNGDLRDQSIFQNHGTIRGGITYGPDRFGSPCGAVEFNGINGYIQIPTSRSLESPTQALAISVWFKTHKNSDKLQWFTIVCKGDEQNESDDSPQYRLQGTSKTLSLNTDFTEFVNLPLQNDIWYHYVMVWDGKWVTSYLNGRKVFQYAYEGKLTPNDQPLVIGRDVPGTDEFFHGSMDQLRIYNRALNSNEVVGLFKDDSEHNRKKPCDPIKPAADPNSVLNSSPYLRVSGSALPSVNILIPNKNPFTADKAEQSILASILGVSNENGIIVRLNGVSTRHFVFNSRRHTLEMMVQLVPGENQIEIIGKNLYGSDQAYTKIIYGSVVEQKPQPPAVVKAQPDRGKITKVLEEQKAPPTILIINPTEELSTTDQPSHHIWAKITNITKQDIISPTINSSPINQYSFDDATGLFDATVSLKEGANTFKLSVKNSVGGDSDIRSIVYTPEAHRPVISLMQPGIYPHETQQSETRISARIQHISDSSQIVFKVNNKPAEFQFDYSTGTFQSQVKLQEGYNIFQIVATNDVGSDKVVEQIIHTKPFETDTKPDLGQIKVIEEIELPARHITITCYDHNKIDGDIVSVVLGDEVLFDKITLQPKESRQNVRDLDLVPGKEYILVSKAWNEGSQPTNTLCVELSDNQGFIRIFKLNSKEGTSEAIRFQCR